MKCQIKLFTFTFRLQSKSKVDKHVTSSVHALAAFDERELGAEPKSCLKHR